MDQTSRRDFIRLGGTAAAGMALAGVAGAQTTRPAHHMDAPPMHAGAMAAVIPGAVENGEYVLPPLPYAYDALEPHIDAQTMRLHHDIHHNGYVNGLKTAEKKLQEARESGDYGMVEHWTKKAAFHGAGHFLHCVFWASMSPDGGGDPVGSLRDHIVKTFGSVDSFRKQFSAAAGSAEGSGWGILAWQIGGKGLTIMQAQNHQLNSQWGLIPLISIDVWEHAYYLKYQNKRGDYVKAWWNTVDWEGANERFEMLVSPA